ncbi:MAG TPA: histidine kinase dimerization/phospho-acceptor domain-containing protein [Longimicrobium sp.]|nr:histidine kinase dimerization/phospho-acceptor domain-containing protein [Longimicrobium sp.]
MTGADHGDGHALSPAMLHDLRTPLGHMIGYAEMLAERAEDAGDERSMPELRKISAAGYRMLALIEQIFTAPPPDAPAAFTWDDVDALGRIGDASRPQNPADAERIASISARIAALLPPR